MPSGRPPYAVIVLQLSHISINETQWHELMDAVNDVDAVGSVEVDFDGLAEAFFGFENDLSAHTAWADGFSREPVFVACGNGKLADRCGGTLCLCGKDGRALTADGGGEGCILLVTPDELGAVVKPDGCAHVEVRVGGIAVLGGLLRLFNKCPFFG